MRARGTAWIRVKAPGSPEYHATRRLMRELQLKTVCEEAACPNIGECWKEKHATVMILGAVCTRACTFCNVADRRPDTLDPHEPRGWAQRSPPLGSSTSSSPRSTATIWRMAAPAFSATDRAIRGAAPANDDRGAGPRFPAQDGAIGPVIAASLTSSPQSRTVPRSTPRCGRARATSLAAAARPARRLDPTVSGKSGIMVGLGERRRVLQ